MLQRLTRDRLVWQRARRILEDLDDTIISRLERDAAFSKPRPLAAAVEAPEEPCSICYDDMQDPTNSICGRHTFCRNCILEWLDRSPTCAMCRYTSFDLMEQINKTAIDDITEALKSLLDLLHSFGYYIRTDTGRMDIKRAAKAVDEAMQAWGRWHEYNIMCGFREIADSDPAKHWFVELMRREVDYHRSRGDAGYLDPQEFEYWEAVADSAPTVPLPEDDDSDAEL